MKVIIKTLEELQNYLKVNSTFRIESLRPYLYSAYEKYIPDLVGKALAASLLDWYNADPFVPSQVNQDLLPNVQRVVAKFAFLEAAPNLDLQLTESGFGVVSNQTLAPASRDRVNRFVSSLESEGWDAAEVLLRFLEDNRTNYATWVSSEAFTMQMRNFINSAEEFDKYVNINKSRLKFRGMRHAMDNIEILRIDPVISEPLANKIREQIRNKNLTPANEALLKLIRRAVALFTAAEEIDTRHRLTAEHFLSEVRKKLDGNPDDYPEYRDSLYIEGRSYVRFENSDDNAFFVAGQ